MSVPEGILGLAMYQTDPGARTACLTLSERYYYAVFHLTD